MQPMSPLAPVGTYIYNDGKSIAKLSAFDRASCARTIYEAIRSRDPGQRLRAGYTIERDPYLAFVSKKSIFSGREKAYRIVEQRRELRNILFKICEAGLSSLRHLSVHETTEVTEFKIRMEACDLTRDLRVRDVLPVVKILADRTKRNQIRNERARWLREFHSPTVDHLRRTDNQRITQFLQGGAPARKELCDVLTLDQDAGPEVAKRAVSALIRLFVRVQTTKGTPLERIAASRASDTNLRIFAERWMKLRYPYPTQRSPSFFGSFSDSWNLLLDKVATLVLNAAPVQTPGSRNIDGSTNQGSSNIDGSTRPGGGNIDGSINPVRIIYAKSIASSDSATQAAAPVVPPINSANISAESEDESDVLVASPPQIYSPMPSPAASPMTHALKNAGKLSGNLSPSPTKDMAEKGDAKSYRTPDSESKTPKSKGRKSLSRLGQSTKRLTRIFNSPVFNSPDKDPYVSRSDIQRLLGGSPVEVLIEVPSPPSPVNMNSTYSPGWQPPISMSSTRAPLASIVTPPQAARSTTAFANQKSSSLSPQPELEVVDKQVIPGREYSPVPLPVNGDSTPDSPVFLPLNTSSTQDSPVRLSPDSNDNSDVGSAPASGLDSPSSDGEKGPSVPKD